MPAPNRVKSVSGSVPTNSVVGTVGVRVSVKLKGQTATVIATWLTGSVETAMTVGLPFASMVRARDGSSAAASDLPSMAIAQSAAAARYGLASRIANRARNTNGNARRTDQRSRLHAMA